jgi:hypothetical protein
MFENRKALNVLHEGLELLEKQGKTGYVDEALRNDLLQLSQLIDNGKNDEALLYAKVVEDRIKVLGNKSFLFKSGEIIFIVGSAFFLTGIIRQMWFDVFEIPLGCLIALILWYGLLRIRDRRRKERLQRFHQRWGG